MMRLRYARNVPLHHAHVYAAGLTTSATPTPFPSARIGTPSCTPSASLGPSAVDPQLGRATRKFFGRLFAWPVGGMALSAAAAHACNVADILHSPTFVATAFVGAAATTMAPLGAVCGAVAAAEHVAVRQKGVEAAVSGLWHVTWGEAGVAAGMGAGTATAPARMELSQLSAAFAKVQGGAHLLLGQGDGAQGIGARMAMAVLSVVLPAHERMVTHVAERCAALAADGQNSVSLVESRHIVAGAAEAFVAGHLQDKRETATAIGMGLLAMAMAASLAVDYAWGAAARKVDETKLAARERVEDAQRTAIGVVRGPAEAAGGALQRLRRQAQHSFGSFGVAGEVAAGERGGKCDAPEAAGEGGRGADETRDNP